MVRSKVATEADRCRLALMGLAPAIRSKLMQDHASTVAKAMRRAMKSTPRAVLTLSYPTDKEITMQNHYKQRRMKLR